MKTLTFAETLHPEDAQAHLGVQDGERGWGVVYNEESSNDYPSAVAHRIDEEDASNESQGTTESPEPSMTVAINDTMNMNPENSGNTSEKPSGRGCFYLEGLIGNSITFSAVTSTFAIELSAAILYTVAAGFYYVATCAEIGILFKAIFLLVVRLLMIVDALLLTISVMITELLGAVSCIATVFFVKSCRSSRDWHLYIRKRCHLTRWVFRGFHEDWALERNFPVDVFDKDAEEAKDSAAGRGSSTHSNRHQDVEAPRIPSDAHENIVVVDHITYEDEKK